jgi:hypothetical protein
MSEDLKKQSVGCGSIVGIVFAVLFILFVLLSYSGNKILEEEEKNWRTMDASTDAYFVATDFVKDLLKSPSSSKFPTSRDSSVRIEKQGETQQYIVTGYVEASNSFGALIKTHYIAKIERTSSTEWRLLNLNWL